MNYYGYPPGYDPNPHHPRPSAPVADALPTTRHARALRLRSGQARLDGGQWISGDGEMIYHQRFGDYWQAHWTGDGFGAWGPARELPEGVVKL